MTPDEFQRVKEIFQQAVERDKIEQAALLDRVCAGDNRLRRWVEELLASDEGIGQCSTIESRTESDEIPAVVSQPDWLSLFRVRAESSMTGSLIGPYRVLREIGQGGMGAVYLAERADGQYRKSVAIKIVLPHLAAEDILRRFRNERQVLATLDHPNIARFLDGGATAEGLPYLVMDYVEGLEIDLWCNKHSLSLSDRLTLFQSVCAAVLYAHDKQVIHCDIKPRNILVTPDGTPKLLDFGIARVLDPEFSLESSQTTMGVRPMTLEYASPEQVRGERASRRSDIYALGVVLFRLLTGQYPYSFQNLTIQQISRVICEQEPIRPSTAVAASASEACGDSPTGLRRKLIGDLDSIILKALHKEPEYRYQSAGELSEDIHRYLQDLPVQARKRDLSYRGRKLVQRNAAFIMVAAAAALIVLTMVMVKDRLMKPRTSLSIAVLPLDNLSGDREQEYLADGITDELIGDLARIPSLQVISRTSTMTFKNVRRRLPEIARALGVQTIAEGSVLRTGNRIKISMRLVDGPKDQSFWAGSYEGELESLLGLQTKLAEAIAGEINVVLTAPDRARIFRQRRVNLDAYDLYLKGRHQYFSGYTQESTEKAIAYFQHALDVDPGYAPAYAALAECYWGLSSVYYAPSDVMPKARWAALRALELDDGLAEAHAMLALVRSSFEFSRAEAERGFKRAIELKSSDALVHLFYGIHLVEVGSVDRAVIEVEQAKALDPISPFMSGYAALPLYFAHRYDETIRRLQPVVDLYPNYHQPHSFLALAYEQKGLWAQAAKEMERAYELDQDQEGLAQLGHIYALSGRTEEARKVLRRLQEISQRRYVSAYNIAVLYAGLDQKDDAFYWLRKVEDDRSEWFAAVNVDPRLESLHSDPRFATVLSSVGLGTR